MGTKERRERERQDTRDKILAAARDMFTDEGYDSVTMRAIADRIEYTPTALYHHFPSKQALLTELCECDFAELGRHFRDAVDVTDPIERLRAVGEAYLRFAEERPSQYRFMFMTVLPPVEVHGACAPGERVDDPERNAYFYLRQACSDAIAQGRLRAEYDDPDMLAQMLWGSVHGLISLRVAKQHAEFVTWKNLRQAVMMTMDTLLRGMVREG